MQGLPMILLWFCAFFFKCNDFFSPSIFEYVHFKFIHIRKAAHRNQKIVFWYTYERCNFNRLGPDDIGCYLVKYSSEHVGIVDLAYNNHCLFYSYFQSIVSRSHQISDCDISRLYTELDLIHGDWVASLKGNATFITS